MCCASVNTHNLKSLRMILSTGSPLKPQSFDYVYQYIKPDICLSSISGNLPLRWHVSVKLVTMWVIVVCMWQVIVVYVAVKVEQTSSDVLLVVVWICPCIGVRYSADCWEWPLKAGMKMVCSSMLLHYSELNWTSTSLHYMRTYMHEHIQYIII